MQFLEIVQRECVTNVTLVPTMINMLVNHPEVAQYEMSSLQYVLYGASPMPEAVITELRTAFKLP